jgi:hypothetical protein
MIVKMGPEDGGAGTCRGREGNHRSGNGYERALRFGQAHVQTRKYNSLQYGPIPAAATMGIRIQWKDKTQKQ